MFGWGHGVVWYAAAPMDPPGGLLGCVVAHAATRHTAASTAHCFADLITLASPSCRSVMVTNRAIRSSQDIGGCRAFAQWSDGDNLTHSRSTW
jgi:hypothetical protein